MLLFCAYLLLEISILVLTHQHHNGGNKWFDAVSCSSLIYLRFRSSGAVRGYWALWSDKRYSERDLSLFFFQQLSVPGSYRWNFYYNWKG